MLSKLGALSATTSIISLESGLGLATSFIHLGIPALGQPLLFGPYMSNFREIVRALRECAGAREVLNENELIAACVELLGDEAQRARMGAAVLAWHAHNRGAVERTLAVIREHLATRG